LSVVVRDFLVNLKLGKLQRFQNMAVIALFAPEYKVIEHLTLRDALKRNLIVVTEVDAGGSIPNLKVINKAADKPVLLLDGEEAGGMAGPSRRRRFRTGGVIY